MTIYDYFDRLTSIGLDEEISEEFDNKIIDALEIIRNHEIGDFENVIEEEDYVNLMKFTNNFRIMLLNKRS